MKAAVVPAIGAPLEIRDLPVPTPGPGQVLVRMQTSGVCHTDIHAAHGDWPVKPVPPFVPGHEGIGVVEQVGPGSARRQVGDRVAIAWLGSACGRCAYCISGRETLCEAQRNSGYAVDGAYAQFAVADERYVVPGRLRLLPRRGPADLRRCHHVQGDQERPRAARRTRRRLRHRRPRAPRAAVRPHRRRHRRRRGHRGREAAPRHRTGRRPRSQRTHDRPRRRDPRARRHRRRHRPRRVPAVIRAGLPVAAPRRAARLRRSPGRGHHADPDLRHRPRRDLGDRVDRRHRQDLADVFALHAAGRTRVVAETRKLDDINEVFDEVLAGRVPARVVLEF